MSEPCVEQYTTSSRDSAGGGRKRPVRADQTGASRKNGGQTGQQACGSQSCRSQASRSQACRKARSKGAEDQRQEGGSSSCRGRRAPAPRKRKWRGAIRSNPWWAATKRQPKRAKNLPPGKAGLQVASLRLDGIVQAPNGMIAVVTNPQVTHLFSAGRRPVVRRTGGKDCDGWRVVP